MDLRNFISRDALHLMFKLNGWTPCEIKDIGSVSLFKPDFYDAGHVIAKSNKAIIIAKGYSSILYKDMAFENTDALLVKFGDAAFADFSNWSFSVEKEWVILKEGEWMTSFSTLDKLPKTTKYRC